MEHLIDIFKIEWLEAHEEGDHGNRVRRALTAVLEELGFDPEEWGE